MWGGDKRVRVNTATKTGGEAGGILPKLPSACHWRDRAQSWGVKKESAVENKCVDTEAGKRGGGGGG